MRIFSKQETVAIVIILLFIFVISFFNFRVALRRGRDNERENDLSDIAKVLDDYKNKNSYYPTSLSAIPSLPKDPGTPMGYSYLYLTDGKFFQLYASLEGGSDESVYSPTIEKLGLKCGEFICNFGKASGETPLDKSLQEYENEINAKRIYPS
jgi:type II secretory pathway pseudopilin PulG